MKMLSPEELNQLLPAEEAALPSPIPPQVVSSDEYYQRRADLANDRLALRKHEYEGSGAGRSNLRYGYVRKPA